jgi:hypothetical protein
MRTWLLPILVGAVFGLLCGVAMYRMQAFGPRSMNELGVIAFASLGISLGCLMAESPLPRRRR